MASQHLLRCDCGRTLSVEARQAGESIACGCGRTIEIPTLLELRKLPAVEPTPEPRASAGAWGWPQQLALASLLLLAVSLPASAYLWATMPSLLSPAEIRRRVERFSPLEAHQGFLHLAQSGLHANYSPEEVRWAATVQRHRMWLLSALFAAGLGVAGVAAGLLIPRLRAASQPRSTES